jgi:hypothetical protein
MEILLRRGYLMDQTLHMARGISAYCYAKGKSLRLPVQRRRLLFRGGAKDAIQDAAQNLLEALRKQ